MDTESPSKKMKRGPSSDTARSAHRDSTDIAQRIDDIDDRIDEVKTMIEKVQTTIEEKHVGPSFGPGRNQTLHGGEAPGTPEGALTMLPISSNEFMQQYDKLLIYHDYRDALVSFFL
ncbi:uncharacterized protein LOC121405656 isoform X2 [Lytechinus variegatus]|uniref:uncharacterized protein LOC121405656 isoform X2 n=1 Tax=Lytechinus variegatus TaxID=7654 RepID=UPI001BB29837|nr:uncharacterized protein LOC121405656 isoform X2 [Lytechinus variegatus]